MPGEKGLVSVIVPVYNTEKYLRQCINSIIDQTYRKLEIILVDDGSTDRSGSICEEYAKQDSRIKVIHQKNGGLSAARNAALDVAAGEYIGFVDSDDYILPGMYENMVHCIEKQEADICVCMYRYEDEDGRRRLSKSDAAINFYGKKTAEEFAVCLYAGGYLNLVAISVWNKLYRRHVFAEERFLGRYAEDDEIFGRIYSKPYSVYVMEQMYYMYVRHENSLVTRKFSPHRYEYLDAMEHRCCQFKNNSLMLNETMRRYCNSFISYWITAKQQGIQFPCEKRRTLRSYFRSLLRSGQCGIRFYIRTGIFCVSPAAYWLIRRVKQSFR